jgi:hypothetical protein
MDSFQARHIELGMLSTKATWIMTMHVSFKFLIRYRVLKQTPHPKPTPINASQLSTLYYLEPYHAV